MGEEIVKREIKLEPDEMISNQYFQSLTHEVIIKDELDDNLKFDSEVTPFSEKPYKCEHCNKTFKLLRNKKTHIHLHTSSKQFSCKYCKKVFPFQSYLDKHITTHTGENLLKCQYCSKTFNRRCHLNQHTVHTHNEMKELAKFSCKYCNKIFMYEKLWADHERSIHTREKPFKCDYCDKKFSRSKDLNFHILTHRNVKKVKRSTSEVPFKCEYCDKIFKRRCHLNEHTVHAHNEMKDLAKFSCKFCNKFFMYEVLCTDHERIAHTGEKPFRCDNCNQNFSRKKDLNSHVLTHKYVDTGEKPINCRYCDCSFFRFHDRYKHERTHLETLNKPELEKPFVCQHCSLSFKRESNLKVHQNKYHRKPVEGTVLLNQIYEADFNWNERFKERLLLDKHESTHTGQSLPVRQYDSKLFPRTNNVIKLESNTTDDTLFT